MSDTDDDRQLNSVDAIPPSNSEVSQSATEPSIVKMGQRKAASRAYHKLADTLLVLEDIEKYYWCIM